MDQPRPSTYEPCEDESPPRRRRSHKHRGNKQKFNCACKKCLEKYIDEQVCSRLEELCIPDGCPCSDARQSGEN